jgi:AbrB family looped-hinge helix DNA binding protein
MGALYLDGRDRLIGEGEAFRGALGHAIVEPRPIIFQALLRGAASVILFHSHPSTDPSPTREDLRFTRRMDAACEASHILGSDRDLLRRWGMPASTLTRKGQLTVPKTIRERLGLHEGDRVEFRVTGEGQVVVEAATVDLRDLRGVLKRRGRTVSVEEMEDVVRKAGTRL